MCLVHETFLIYVRDFFFPGYYIYVSQHEKFILKKMILPS